ncbi:MAG: TRAP transporter substrate-binding protein [Alphaproteobacteria bacterium]|nr:TRAP transporter substrate-binding protein [Alphaproteobacteria bacterium]MBV9554177.1 TRAP transporter substrate-binding protein [Alphaproteobacteria bacterium]
MRYWLLGLLLLAALPARSQEHPPLHLKVVGGLGATVQFKNYEEPFWSKQLAERSGGKITAEVTPWDQFGIKGNELLQFTRLGAIVISTVSLSQIASEDPEAAAVDLAGLNPDIPTLRRSIKSYLPTLRDVYRSRYGLELLAIWSYPAQVIFCNRAIDNLADLKGVNVRVASAMHGDFVEGLGGTGITIPFDGLMDGLKKHVADCAITGAASGYRLGLYRASTHLDPTTVSWGPYVLFANRAAWQRFEPGVRDFLTAQIAELGDRLWVAAEHETQEGVACLTGGSCAAGPAAHMTLVPASENDLKLVRKSFVTAVAPRWSQRCGAECVANWNNTVGREFNLTVAAGN